jgi:hypothetical protein
LSKKPPPHEELLQARRERVEAAWKELQQAAQSEFGRAPRTRTWILPLVAAATGLALALSLKRKLRAGKEHESLLP